MRSTFRVLLLSGLLVMLSGCGYNAMQRGDKQAKVAWSQVINQYQRRARLVPDLVNIVKEHLRHEDEVVAQVVHAHARVARMPVMPDLPDNAVALQRFRAAQRGLGKALSRLMAVAEHNPGLNANVRFQNLQAQLKDTESRLALARQRYTKAVHVYNSRIGSFPQSLTAKMFGYTPKPEFTTTSEAGIPAPE